jgi:hypothetical protein
MCTRSGLSCSTQTESCWDELFAFIKAVHSFGVCHSWKARVGEPAGAKSGCCHLYRARQIMRPGVNLYGIKDVYMLVSLDYVLLELVGDVGILKMLGISTVVSARQVGRSVRREILAVSITDSAPTHFCGACISKVAASNARC